MTLSRILSMNENVEEPGVNQLLSFKVNGTK